MLDPWYQPHTKTREVGTSPDSSSKTKQGNTSMPSENYGSKDPRMAGFVPPSQSVRMPLPSGGYVSLDYGSGLTVVKRQTKPGELVEPPPTYETFVTNFQKLFGREPKPEEIWEAALHSVSERKKE